MMMRFQELNQDIVEADLFERIKSAKYIPDRTDAEQYDIVEQFISKYQHRPFDLSYKCSENLYSQETYEMFSSWDPLRVQIEDFKFPEQRRRPKWSKPPETDYAIHIEELENWFWENLNRCLAGLAFDVPPMDILDDDRAIVQRICESIKPIHIVVTDDKKLIKLLQNLNTPYGQQKIVLGLPCRMYCVDLEESFPIIDDGDDLFDQEEFRNVIAMKGYGESNTRVLFSALFNIHLGDLNIELDTGNLEQFSPYIHLGRSEPTWNEDFDIQQIRDQTTVSRKIPMTPKIYYQSEILGGMLLPSNLSRYSVATMIRRLATPRTL
jgi:hypothetical protein